MNRSSEPRTAVWTAPPDSSAGEDPRVIAALEEYLAELEAGRRPDRQQFLQRHADVADALDRCLDGLQIVHAMAPCLRPAGETGAVLPNSADDAMPATPLGDYRILREIGRGGMGIVYEAVQLSLGRRVALKVLPFAAALDSKQLQRFTNEAKAAAHLHHPGIVPVYAVGCERGVHYYAMQYVEGQSLAALIQGLKDARLPIADLAVRETINLQSAISTITAEWGSSRTAFCRRVAQLGQKAAEALEHAHQLAIVHRDIKPANLLLDGRAQLWITDFGLALMQNDAGVTMTGEVLGTLRYMSPEQALGQRGTVDHRTDIYSVGATLYELLTLEPLFHGQGRHELLQRIATEEPRPPRALDPAIPVELETILLKALAKNPAERYLSAQELADDLQRFLEDRPILARRPTLLERATKWARRHRALVATALFLLIGTVGVLLATTLLIAREHAKTQQAYDREHDKAEEARLQHGRAEESFRQARQAVDLLAEISEKGLGEPSHAQGLRRRLLEAALGYYQDFIEQHQDDPSITAELAASRARVARLLEELTALQGSGQFRALTNKAVQDNLQLSASQREQVVSTLEQLSEDWRHAFKDFRHLDAEARWARSLELARAEEKALADLLSTEQARRFRQIILQLQQRGPEGFSDPDVVHALKLTKKQCDKIRTIQYEAYVMSRDAWPPEGGFKKGRKRPGETWQTVQERVLTIFTPEQGAKWQEMTGEPVAVEGRVGIGVGFEHWPPFAGRPGGRPGPPGRPPDWPRP